MVQGHHARRLHWDFRLERDGVLVSWVLPRGFPDDPSEDLPAAHAEDHPLDYLEFEGTIPEGSYGAGEVRVWDRGTFVCEAFDDRKVVVLLHGERLRGRYALYQARDDWRIHRMDPPDPERRSMPERIVPMLAQLGELPADGDRYGFEVKWDGIRAIAYWQPGRLNVQTRKLADVTSLSPSSSSRADRRPVQRDGSGADRRIGERAGSTRGCLIPTLRPEFTGSRMRTRTGTSSKTTGG